jgi:hypothetical protein
MNIWNSDRKSNKQNFHKVLIKKWGGFIPSLALKKKILYTQKNSISNLIEAST